MTSGKVAYIAGAYRSDTINGMWENIMFARKYALKYWKLGYSVICPHMNTAFMDGEDTDELFLKGDHEILLRCDVIVMIPGWDKSQGATAELKLAEENKKEIIYED